MMAADVGRRSKHRSVGILCAWALVLGFLAIGCTDDPDPLYVDAGGDPALDSHVVPGCYGACYDIEYNACTCDPSDPCDWIEDGFCDVYYCMEIAGGSFDDSVDCGEAGGCDGDCGFGSYTSCTCAADDPCNWVDDGYCDETPCSQLTTDYFDDSADCGGATGACDGECATGRYSSCTCAAADPCGWASDGQCDARCSDLLGSDAFDDSADCGGPPPTPTPGNSFGVTAVRDDLDNRDMEMMADGLTGRDYVASVRDTNVTSSDLVGYLAQNLSILYHTGHGLEGLVATADGEVGISDVTINTATTIFATCLTLERSWAPAMSASAETVLGYTKVSFDWVDETVVTNFLGQLDGGRSMIESWYLANTAISDVSDRWAGYVREGGSVVEYSARTGNTPSCGPECLVAHDLEPAGRAERVWLSRELLASDGTFELAGLPIVSAGDARVESSMNPGGWTQLGASRITRDEAREIADAFIEDRLEVDDRELMFDSVVEIVAQADDASEAVVVGYTVTYGRRVGDMPIRGNRIVDHIALLVGPRGVVAWSMYWPELTVVPVTAAWDGDVLTVGEAARTAAESISSSVKGELRLIDVRPVLGVPGENSGRRYLVPCYELTTVDGTHVVIDALTGRPLL